ncbi:hypothetical protein NI459_00300 [Acinetobacter schindleri]|uniref:hypothetical protein n=1 Tax=Acinetobacter schindleri TaxID=108981 RepID=UPI00209B2E12|nr:hypothetical protein [Acinetobacter schindleri]MCO8066098.1 hypothetical protein [Acinetobacter schindleri]
MKKLLLVGLIFGCTVASAADYKTLLTGKKLVMQGASCAGISLTKNAGLLSEGSSSCSVDLSTRVKWVDEDTFILIEKIKTNETSPPRVYLYNIKSIKGNKVVLSEIWTGWNSFPDEEITYTIK